MVDFKGYPNQGQQPVVRQAVEEDEVENMRDNMKHVFAASYNSVAINISQCKAHDNEFLVESEALGVKLQLIYFINHPQLGLNELLQLAFQDFCEFVVVTRREDNATIN